MRFNFTLYNENVVELLFCLPVGSITILKIVEDLQEKENYSEMEDCPYSSFSSILPQIRSSFHNFIWVNVYLLLNFHHLDIIQNRV